MRNVLWWYAVCIGMGTRHAMRPVVGPRFGAVKRKVVLLLWAGLGLALARTPTQQYRIMHGVYIEWREINSTSLQRAVHALEKDRVIQTTRRSDGTFQVTLTPCGKKMAQQLYLDELTLEHSVVWDGKWRIVMYDVPETSRDFRLQLCHTLKSLGFYELQRSVLVYPFECRKEIDMVTRTYGAEQYVRYVEASYIGDELELRAHFHLT
jgi:DNA-binding PadR family transcriptional regulator